MGAFTVFYDGQFWVGIATRERDGGGSEVARVVFGPEPTDAVLAEWFRTSFHRLDYAPAEVAVVPEVRSKNPKRREREARALAASPRLCTAAQEAWSSVLEGRKRERAVDRRAAREQAAEERYALRCAKKKQKRRGH